MPVEIFRKRLSQGLIAILRRPIPIPPVQVEPVPKGMIRVQPDRSFAYDVRYRPGATAAGGEEGWLLWSYTEARYNGEMDDWSLQVLDAAVLGDLLAMVFREHGAASLVVLQLAEGGGKATYLTRKNLGRESDATGIRFSTARIIGERPEDAVVEVDNTAIIPPRTSRVTVKELLAREGY